MMIHTRYVYSVRYYDSLGHNFKVSIFETKEEAQEYIQPLKLEGVDYSVGRYAYETEVASSRGSSVEDTRRADDETAHYRCEG